MRHLNGVYTQTYNRRHGRTGHVFQGRFKAVLVDRDAYLLEVCRYVDLNPVRAGMVRKPLDWPWSSYRAHSGGASIPDWLASAELHRRLTSHALQREGPRRYAEFVAQGKGVKLWETALRGQIYLGDEEFAKRMQARAPSRDLREVPRKQRRSVSRPLSYYLSHYSRDVAITRAYREGGHTQSAIAQVTGLSVSRISRVIAAAEAKGKT